MSESTKQMATDHGDDYSNNKPFITPIPSLFPYSFMFPLVIAYLDDQDVMLSLLLVNKAMMPHLKGYRMKAPIGQHIAVELSKLVRYLNIVPTQLNQVTDLASLSRFTSITSIRLDDIYKDVILPGTFPQSITELHLGSYFSPPITRKILPNQLKKLTLSAEFNHAIAPGMFPDSLESLHFGTSFDQPLVPGSLPVSLSFLSLGHRFNHPLQPGVLPSKLVTLKLSTQFDYKLNPGVLPVSLLDLYFGTIFNRRLEPGDLPPSITKLHMGMCFNHELSPGVLPVCLIKLELSRDFNKPLFPFPATLQTLALGHKFNHPIPSGVLPTGLKYLALSSIFDKSLDGVLPALTKLSGCFDSGQVSTPIVEQDRIDLARSQGFMSPGRLLSSITDLTIRGRLLQLGSIPSSVTRLRLKSAIAPGIVPGSVTHLLWDTRDSLDVGVVPSSVTHLIFGNLFNRPIPPSAIPSSVTHLVFGQDFNKQITPMDS